jgi:hypothetical protein
MTAQTIELGDAERLGRRQLRTVARVSPRQLIFFVPTAGGVPPRSHGPMSNVDLEPPDRTGGLTTQDRSLRAAAG